MEQNLGKRLVLFPYPFTGHQNPMFELGNILHSRGFQISIVHTRFHVPDPFKYPHFSLHLIDDGMSVTEPSFAELIDIANQLNKNCIESFKLCLSALHQDQPVACLIVDAVWHFTHAVADELAIPRMVLYTGSMTLLTVYVASGHLDPGGKEPEDLVPGRHPLRFKDIADLGSTEQSPIQELTSNVIRLTVASKGVIFNSIKEIEDRSLEILQQEYPMPCFPVGPFHKWLPREPENESSLSWLDTQAPNSVLYVSFGSLAAINETGFIEMAWGLAKSNQPFLWVVRDDLVHKADGSSELPDEFLQEVSGRGHIIGWAPQKAVLAHPAVGGFWTHCGWNSTLESIAEGVPMICSPFFADQMVGARYVTDVWMIGLWLEKGSERDDVGKAIQKLMAENEGEEMREKASCLKDKVSKLLPHGGSSCHYMDELVKLIMSFET